MEETVELQLFDVVAVGEADRESCALCVRLTVPERLADTVQVAVNVLINVAVVVPVRVGVGLRERTEEGDALRDPDSVELTLELREAREDAEPEPDRLELPDTDRDRLPEAVKEDECEPVRLTVPVRVPPRDGVPVLLTVLLRVFHNDNEAHAEREGLRVDRSVTVLDPDRLLEGDALPLFAADGPVVPVRELRELTEVDGVER